MESEDVSQASNGIYNIERAVNRFTEKQKEAVTADDVSAMIKSVQSALVELNPLKKAIAV